MKTHGGLEELEDTRRITKTFKHTDDYRKLKAPKGPQKLEETRKIRSIIHAWVVKFTSRPFDKGEERVYHTL